MKPIKLLFEENITNVGSWNGVYTGSRKPCYTVKEISDPKWIKFFQDKVGERNEHTYFYNFGDGYSSSCTISIVTALQARQKLKKDYAPCRDFFVEDILKYGYIRERKERHAQERAEKLAKMAPEFLSLLKELRQHVKFKPMPELQKNCPKAKIVNKVDQLLKELAMSTFKYTKEYLKENKIAIKCESLGELARVSNILDAKTRGCLLNDNESYVSFSAGYNGFGIYGRQETDEQVIKASKYLSDYDSNRTNEASKPKRKIKGYKAPVDMFKLYHGHVVHKGDLYVKNDSKGLNGYYLEKQFDIDPDTERNTTYFPDEIVEQWEPVYEEEKPTFGSFSDIIKHFNGASVFIDGYIKIDDKNHNGDFIYIENNKFNFTDSFQSELKELGIKI